ncbi:Triacylglycerol lipase 2 [Camellia lanceoleosa]|uniref:Triacylglycerol lipase 2 n=1 Tax=Camellia lanceoleosa TaxID=1840588 RepID=A0ACC0H5S3_9ERIC|nr:Triacylglycerol lipase 2 [Camellia lanceoleosa]
MANTLPTLLCLNSIESVSRWSKEQNCHPNLAASDVSFQVTTKDGYILGMQRIPGGDSVTWLLNSPDESLAFILADNGFDAYWDWSWDELVAYDLPATFNYVHAQTGQNMHYVDIPWQVSFHTLLSLVLTFTNYSMNFPIATFGQMSSLLARAAADAFLYTYWLGSGMLPLKLEGYSDETHSNCADLVIAFTGKNCCVNNSKTGTFLEHEPQPTATKTMIHLSQMIRWGTIAMYDYGSKFENNQHYGKPTPPVYNMASIPKDLPLFLSHGGQDLLSDVKDVKTLLATLKGHHANKLVVQYRKDYAHSDFVFGVNANKLVYDPLMAFFKLH